VTTPVRLEDVRRAWDANDPELVPLVLALAEQTDPPPAVPIRQGAPTFDLFLRIIRGHGFNRKTPVEQRHFRVEQIKALEAPDAEVPLSDRLRLHDFILDLWNDNGTFARTYLLQIIARIPLVYGPWRALKRIYKEAEARDDTEVLGALAARFDATLARGSTPVSRATLSYLSRRAWRYLRRLGVSLPAVYADAAVDFLAPYTNDTYWRGTWVANHIFFHESKKYNRASFTLHPYPTNLLEHRAYPDLWKRTPRPLFSLLERAQSDQVLHFAASALKADFRASLREVEPGWVARLVGRGSKAIDEFVVWILQNVPRFEQSAFRTLGLHEAVLKLFDSPAPTAQAYAADYARTYARDLPVDELVRLANNSHEAVRKLAADLLLGRDPRKEVGLEAWGKLLDTQYGHPLAAEVIRKHFGASELTPAWFADRLFTSHAPAFQFIKTILPQVHPAAKLGATFFIGLIDRLDDPAERAVQNVAGFALAELSRFDLNTLDADFLQRLVLHPTTSRQAIAWINEGRLKAQTIPVAFWKVLAYHPAWDADPWIAALKQRPQPWAQQLGFGESLADQVLIWLKDVRRFGPSDLGLDWLMQLVVRSEERYHDFALDVLSRSFTPSDFAPKSAAAPTATPAAPITVDLAKATFLFTGKLATMNRNEAEGKVKTAGGVNAASVTPKLHYLVIGDEGSPLYGAGAKGSKQTKAEDLNAKGANIKIISETAFLQMLVGGVKEVSADASLAGSERLWAMATAPGQVDAPLARFAIQYLRRHHPDIALKETDRPVDPGAEIPAAFLTFERVEPLFAESRKPLRDLALELARWEFARWAPSAPALLKLAEMPYGDVRKFVSEALLADDAPEHRRYRINPDTLSPAAVYSFCESADEATRTLGMKLIEKSPRLQVPEELFRLTESPDRRVRAFIIRTLWGLYRDRGITTGWKPYIPTAPTVGGPNVLKAAAADAERRGTGAPHRPEKLPAEVPSLAEFLRRVLFEIPPGGSESAKTEDGEGPAVKLKRLPARKAKLSLVEVLRDLALEDAAFAKGILPLLEEFMVSRGVSERAACLVAVTRIKYQANGAKVVAGERGQ
jgi:hypothetical protein